MVEKSFQMKDGTLMIPLVKNFIFDCLVKIETWICQSCYTCISRHLPYKAKLNFDLDFEV